MNCEEFELVVRDLARGDVGNRELAPSRDANEHEQATDRAEAHAGACASCALRLQEERLLSRRLDGLAKEMMSVAPPARVEAELLRAFRQTNAQGIPRRVAAAVVQRKSVEEAGDRRASRIVGIPAYWLTAAAAVLLIVLGIVLVRAKLSPTKSPVAPGPGVAQEALKGPSRNSTSVPVEGPNGKGNAESNPANVSPDTVSDRIAIHRLRTKPRKITPQPQPATHDAEANAEASVAATTSSATSQSTEEQTEREVTTQFIALSYVAPANLQDGGQIVRVELPRSAMASFGLPVNMDRLGERVKADVLVSADGFARAIRFVQ